MAGDLNSKHVDWNSRLNTRRGKLLREYADRYSCLIFGSDSRFSLTLRVAHLFTAHRIALTSVALTGPASKLSCKN